MSKLFKKVDSISIVHIKQTNYCFNPSTKSNNNNRLIDNDVKQHQISKVDEARFEKGNQIITISKNNAKYERIRLKNKNRLQEVAFMKKFVIRDLTIWCDDYDLKFVTDVKTYIPRISFYKYMSVNYTNCVYISTQSKEVYIQNGFILNEFSFVLVSKFDCEVSRYIQMELFDRFKLIPFLSDTRFVSLESEPPKTPLYIEAVIKKFKTMNVRDIIEYSEANLDSSNFIRAFFFYQSLFPYRDKKILNFGSGYHAMGGISDALRLAGINIIDVDLVKRDGVITVDDLCGVFDVIICRMSMHHLKSFDVLYHIMTNHNIGTIIIIDHIDLFSDAESNFFVNNYFHYIYKEASCLVTSNELERFKSQMGLEYVLSYVVNPFTPSTYILSCSRIRKLDNFSKLQNSGSPIDSVNNKYLSNTWTPMAELELQSLNFSYEFKNKFTESHIDMVPGSSLTLKLVIGIYNQLKTMINPEAILDRRTSSSDDGIWFNSSYNNHILVDHFTGVHRIKSVIKGYKSISELSDGYVNNKFDITKYKSKLNLNKSFKDYKPFTLDSCIYAFSYIVTEIFEGGKLNIIDPYAGFGSRAMCAGLFNFDYYGIDVNDELVNDLNEMISELEISGRVYIGDSAMKSSYISIPLCDVAIMCPPYSDAVKWSNHSDQAAVKYSDFWEFMELSINCTCDKLQKESVILFCGWDYKVKFDGSIIKLWTNCSSMFKRRGFLLDVKLTFDRDNGTDYIYVLRRDGVIDNKNIEVFNDPEDISNDQEIDHGSNNINTGVIELKSKFNFSNLVNIGDAYKYLIANDKKMEYNSRIVISDRISKLVPSNLNIIKSEEIDSKVIIDCMMMINTEKFYLQLKIGSNIVISSRSLCGHEPIIRNDDKYDSADKYKCGQLKLATTVYSRMGIGDYENLIYLGVGNSKLTNSMLEKFISKGVYVLGCDIVNNASKIDYRKGYFAFTDIVGGELIDDEIYKTIVSLSGRTLIFDDIATTHAWSDGGDIIRIKEMNSITESLSKFYDLLNDSGCVDLINKITVTRKINGAKGECKIPSGVYDVQLFNLGEARLVSPLSAYNDIIITDLSEVNIKTIRNQNGYNLNSVQGGLCNSCAMLNEFCEFMST